MYIDPGELNKRIQIQYQDPDTEAWSNVITLYARVNKAGGGQTFEAGADQHPYLLDFDIRYSSTAAKLVYAPHLYRVLYAGHAFKIVDTDDYMEGHQYLRIRGRMYEP